MVRIGWKESLLMTIINEFYTFDLMEIPIAKLILTLYGPNIFLGYKKIC